MSIELGKIQSLRFGFGGYDDAMFGVSFTLGGESWGVSDFWGTWPPSHKRSEHAKWSEADRINAVYDTQRRLEELMRAAKVKDLNDLVGIPVQCEFDGKSSWGSRLSSWRVLTEVL